MFLLSVAAAGEMYAARQKLLPQLWVLLLALFVAAPVVLDSAEVAVAQHSIAADRDPGAQGLADTLRNLPVGQLVYAPAGLPGDLRGVLMRTRHWAPSYFDGIDNAFDREADEVKVLEARGAAYVLMPEGTLTGVGPDNRRRSRLLRFGYIYRQTRTPYAPLSAVREEIAGDFECSTTLILAERRWRLCHKRSGE